jgi:hypothetical protein
MNLLTPLGLLGLLGLVILIIIYIVKPNYQNKMVSSTYIWKLSLNYKKKKIPVSKLRNILILICQVLAITASAFILAQPFINNEDKGGNETVIILDGSASMLTDDGIKTRFERAIEKAREKSNTLLEDGKSVSVILADDEANYVAQRVTLSTKDILNAELDTLRDTLACSLTTPDISGAMSLAEEITAYNKKVEVILYSDTEYIDKDEVKVELIRDANEWNAAILDVRAIKVDNYYRIEIDVASYGKDSDLTLYYTFNGINSDKSTIEDVTTARCMGDAVTTVVFYTDVYAKDGSDDSSGTNSLEGVDEIVSIASYETLHVRLSEDDAFPYDDSFFLYGGKKPELKVQYYSPMPNNFFSTALTVIKNQLGDYWEINVTEVKYEETPSTEGFDLYVFEHYNPTAIPNDGIVFLVNPASLPSSTGIQLGTTFYDPNGKGVNLSGGDVHPITNKVNAENITVSRYTAIASYDGYVPLMYAGTDPVALVSEDASSPVVVMSFSLNFSNLPLLREFPLFVYNVVQHFAPQTFDNFVYDVGDTVTLNARTENLTVVGPDINETVTKFPKDLTLNSMGTYTVSQELLSGETLIESFYVKLDTLESNINTREDMLSNPYFYPETDTADTDLLLYFAIALVALLFIEWWLKSREQF